MCKRSNVLSRPVLIGRGLDGYFLLVFRSRLCSFEGPVRKPDRALPVAIARGKHLFPFRTEKLSPSAPMVLGGQLPGRVGRRRFDLRPPRGAAFSFPSVAHRSETVPTG